MVGVTGASGAPIARKVLEGLRDAHEETVLVLSRGAEAVVEEELGGPASALLHPLAGSVWRDDDLAAPYASGSRRTRAMAIVPCSTNTVAKVALGLADTLLTRVAQVHLKERRPLVIVPRETPLSAIVLRHLASLAELGVVVLVASPPYYTHPASVEDQTSFLAGKVLDHLGVPHALYRGWRQPA